MEEETENCLAQYCPDLEVNQACLIVDVQIPDMKMVLNTQSSECDKCSLIPSKHLVLGSNNSLALDSFYKINLTVTSANEDMHTLCSHSEEFGDHGIYCMTIRNESENFINCTTRTIDEPLQVWIPLLVALSVYVILALLWIGGKRLYRTEIVQKLCMKQNQDIQVDMSDVYANNSKSAQDSSQKKPRRLRSLDTVRGIAIVVMVFVNYGGGKYLFFDHALWNGLTVADLVFPWFIWIMGVSMALSLRSLLRKSFTRTSIFKKIVKRSIILFALGIMLNTFGGHNDIAYIRIPGVLQRFSISYFVVATVHMFFAKPEDTHSDAVWASLRDIFLYWGEWLVMLGFLIAHILLTFLLVVPGCPVGYLGPGGLHDYSQHRNCTGGAAGYIDRVVLGVNHLYQRPTFKKLYQDDLPYDPEGILGCLTSIFLVYLGLQAGKILLTYKDCKQRIIRWLSWAIITGVIPLILTRGTQNDGWIPINKNLWSVSFILATGSMAFILLSACYILIDVKAWWTGSPFYYPGMNSILVYIGHSITGGMFPWSWKPGPYHGAHLAVSLWGTSLWVIISIWLYYKKIFLAI